MADWNRETPWRQGHLIDKKALAALGLNANNESGIIAIIITHDCDLAQDSAVEPTVEILQGKLINALDGNYTNSKSSRTLHISFEGQVPIFAEFVATDKIYIGKHSLAGFLPNETHFLSVENKTTFQRWLSSRYRRSAFPDEFENRLVRITKLSEKIAKAVKATGECVSAIFFNVDDGEELPKSDENDVYILDIMILHSETPSYEDAGVAANVVKKVIEKAFRDKIFDDLSNCWKHIELRSIEVYSEYSLNYNEFKSLKAWRLDHVSLGATPQQPIAPD